MSLPDWRSGRILAVVSMVLLQFGLSDEASARWAKAEDMPSVTQLDHTEMWVRKDGTLKIRREYITKINNDNGRETESVQIIPFNGRVQKLKVLLAETVNGKKRTSVDLASIDYKETGDFTKSFDSQKQAQLSFPDVQVGSRIHVKYEIASSEAPIDGFFSTGYVFDNGYFEDFRLKVHSEIPLFSWTNDDRTFDLGFKQASQDSEGARTEFEIRSKIPIVRATVQEEDPYIPGSRGGVVVITAKKDWSEYARSVVRTQEELLAKPLPPFLASIRDAAQKESTTLGKLNRVTELLSHNVRYFGDWRRRNGGYIPRSLVDIEKTRYGDCKDFSLASTAIYRALGLKADMAWVWRGNIPPWTGSYRWPVDPFFNHAITRVEADGKVFWIDGTNAVSRAQGPFFDIAGRPAFVLNKDKAFLDTIPSLGSDDYLSEANLAYDLRGDRTVRVEGFWDLKGRAATFLTWQGFYKPVETVNYEIIRSLSNYGNVSDSKVGEFDRSSRQVKDLRIPVAFTLPDIGLRTSAGFGFPLMRENVVTYILYDTRDRVSDLVLESPGVSRTISEIRNVRKVGKQSLDCELKSEWISFKRQVTSVSKGVRVFDEIRTEKHIIPNQALKTEAFSRFQNQVRECFNRSALVLESR